jgi:RNA polymerase sigma-70 factor (ECF subfamily)
MIIDKDNVQENQKFYELIKRIHENPKLGIEEFYNEYKQFLYAIAKIFQRSTITEDEIVQEVLVKVWKASKHPKNIENPKGWIYTITVNSAKSMLRKHKFYPLNEDIVAIESGMEYFIEIDSFNYLIQNLSPKEKEIIIKKVLLKSTLSEIAQAMEMPMGSISSIYYRSLDKIKEELEKKLKNF